MLLLLMSSLWGQNCSYTNNVDSLLRESAENIVIKEIRLDSNHLYFDSVNIPNDEVEHVLGLISSIYEQSETEDFQEIFSETKWHFNDDVGPTLHTAGLFLTLSTDSNQNWMDTLSQNITFSGNLVIDSLINLYSLESFNYYTFSNYKVISLKSNLALQYINLANIFQNVDSVIEAYEENNFIMEGCFNNYTLTSSPVGDTLTFRIENNFSPYSSSSYWQYFVDTNCVATLIKKSVGVCPAVGIKEINNDVRIYPNPVKNYLFIDLENSSNISYSIFNVLGEKVLDKTYNSLQNIFQINVSNLEKGIYFIQLNNSIAKFVKE